MKIKKLFLKIYLFLIILSILSLIIFYLLGNKNRIGYLGDFEYNVDNTLRINGLLNIKDNFIVDGKLDYKSINNFIFTNDSITNYSYSFRIKYYDKVFRNNDIYNVYIDINKIIKDNNFIEEIEMRKNGGPYGDLISSKAFNNEEKIDNVYYTLRIKTNLLLLFVFLLFLYLIFQERFRKSLLYIINIIISFFINHKKYIIILYSSLTVVFILFVIITSSIKHKSKLTDIELVNKSNVGYIYKAKINKFSNLFHINTAALNNTNIIKYYGYSLEITNKPESHYVQNTNIYYTDNNSFIIYNEADNNIYYYNIEFPNFAIGDKYKITILAKQIPESSIIKWSLNGNNLFRNTIKENSSNDYIVLTDTREINYNTDNSYSLRFIMPKGITEIKSILLENLNNNLNLENDYIVFTSNNSLEDSSLEISYNLNPDKKLITIAVISIFIILLLVNINASLYVIFASSILIYLIYLIVGSVNIVVADEWELVNYYDIIKNSNKNIFELLSFLFNQHNEHRIFFSRIISLPILELTKWNTTVITYISFIIYIVGCFFIIKYFYKKDNRYISILMSFLFVILFSLRQRENTIWSFQIAWYIIFTATVLSFYFYYLYTINNKKVYIIFTIIFGIIASFSSAQGLIIWMSFLILLVLFFLSKEISNINKKSLIMILLFGISCFILYFYGYHKPSNEEFSFSSQITNTFFIAISSSIYKNLFLGIVLFLLSIFITIYLIINKKIVDNIFPLLLLIFSYGFILSITISRSSYGVASRYVTFTNLLPIALFILYFNNFTNIFYKYKNFIFVISVIIFMNNSIPALNSLYNEYRVRKILQYRLVNYKNFQNRDYLSGIYPWGTLNDLKNRFSVLEKYNFNVFYSKYDYLKDNNEKGE
ncbi:hypothetical protein GQX62_07265 [Brachyspira hyodysenteriae]|uniref:hypothetical protein n=1 Tax=Brachyspira hyodysenteriae TaxID=159 RepID=UPI001ADD9553|nr:hypothetical protein [Brachyspira hyodysenteriae]QTM03440.1 hypothetical protein GQX62_07265 [Brachyspira hyodysenteriae]